MKRIAVVRVRGRAENRKDVDDTLKNLRVTRVNYCSIIDGRESNRGMLFKVKDHVTWGEIDEKDCATILRNRGELQGGKKLTDSHVKENTKYKNIDEFAKAFVDFKAELSEIPGLKKFFRLHPPRGGYGKIKRAWSNGGALGGRTNMKDLIYRMR